VAVAVVAIVFAFSSSSWFAFSGNWYALFKAIHVSVAVFWVGGGLLLTVLALRAQRTGDPDEIVTIARQAAFVGEKLFAPAGLVVLAMGIAMMVNTNWGWGHFWVVVGLLGYASTLALIDRIMLIARIDVAVLLVVILDMVTKPFA
jgi:uncharacterized membrane protein